MINASNGDLNDKATLSKAPSSNAKSTGSRFAVLAEETKMVTELGESMSSELSWGGVNVKMVIETLGARGVEPVVETQTEMEDELSEVRVSMSHKDLTADLT